MKITLSQTCDSCPEQYDAYMGDTQVGYLRLRWGSFTVQYPNVDGKTIYMKEYPDDFMGRFHSETERTKQLRRAKAAILREINNDRQRNSRVQG